MAIYSLGVLTTSGTTGAATWEIRTTSTDRAALLELGFFLSAATASTFGFGKPAAIGVGPTSPVTLVAEDASSPAGTTTSALAWGTTAPTAPTNFNRRIGLPATIGVGMIWTFPRGYIIAISSSCVLWNLATNSVVNAYVVEDE
jgi:hypothetical protein